MRHSPRAVSSTRKVPHPVLSKVRRHGWGSEPISGEGVLPASSEWWPVSNNAQSDPQKEDEVCPWGRGGGPCSGACHQQKSHIY